MTSAEQALHDDVITHKLNKNVISPLARPHLKQDTDLQHSRPMLAHIRLWRWVRKTKEKHFEITSSAFRGRVFFCSRGAIIYERLFFHRRCSRRRSGVSESVVGALTKCKSNFRRMWTRRAKSISSIYHSFCELEIFASSASFTAWCAAEA